MKRKQLHYRTIMVAASIACRMRTEMKGNTFTDFSISNHRASCISIIKPEDISGEISFIVILGDLLSSKQFASYVRIWSLFQSFMNIHLHVIPVRLLPLPSWNIAWPPCSLLPVRHMRVDDICPWHVTSFLPKSCLPTMPCMVWLVVYL